MARGATNEQSYPNMFKYVNFCGLTQYNNIYMCGRAAVIEDYVWGKNIPHWINGYYIWYNRFICTII